MKKIIFTFENLINVVLYSFVFIASLYIPSDPDLGWHLKYGEYFFKTGEVLKTNPLTQLMPDYRWNNSSWLTDLITYQAFSNFNFLGITILGAIVITLTVFFFGKAAKLSIFEKSIIFPLLVYITSPVNSIAFRGQILSLMILGIMYYILSLYEKDKKLSLLLIPLFLVWGNLHGQYLIGLGLFFLWIIIYLTKEAYLEYRKDIRKLVKDNIYLLVSFVGSAFAILINPFGIGVYLEALSFSNNPLQKDIVEFIAPVDFSIVWWHLLFLGSTMVAGVMLLGTGKRNLDKAPFYLPSFLLLLFTFWIKRYTWTFYYMSIFLLQPVVHFFEPDNKRHSQYTALVLSIAFLLIAIFIKQPFSQFTHMNWDKYCRITVNCSAKASEFVIKNKLNNDKLFTIYDYGGFIDWNYPEIKPTIDGRMHLWRDKNNFSAFAYFLPIEQNTTKDINEAPYNTVLTSRLKPVYFRLQELANEGKWRLVYQDDYSAVFIRLPSETH